MRNLLALMLLAGACCLVFSQEARSDVNTITEVVYYEPTNSIRVTAETIASYDTLAYYDVTHWGQVNKDDTALTGFSGGIYDGNDAYYEEYFPYDPNAEYTIEAYPQLVLKIRHDYGDQYEDYYNYAQWTYGDPVYFPYYFDFSGPGPDVQINGNSISLGGVYSLFTEGALAGQPDHVKVLSDTTDTSLNSCGFPARRITVQPVDINGRRAGLYFSMRERFFTVENPFAEIGGVWTTCTNEWVTPSGRTMYLGGFLDRLFAGCPDPPPSSFCGMPEFVNKWIWCPRGRPEKVLSTNVYDVTSQYVLINGLPQYYPNTHLH